jgi:hypothetical protein
LLTGKELSLRLIADFPCCRGFRPPDDHPHDASAEPGRCRHMDHHLCARAVAI